jgi:flavin-dependent dehydrogenase
LHYKVIAMQTYDVAVIGAGLAGLQCTRLLAGHGLRVVLVDRKQSLDQAVHTTGIFVRRSFEDFALPPACFGPPIRHVTLYSPSRRAIELESAHDEFRVAHMGLLYTRLLKDCLAAGAEWLPAASYVGCEAADGDSTVQLKIEGQARSITARYLVAADGTQSRVARDLGLSINRHWIVGLEEVFVDVPSAGSPRLHCFLDHRLAPGYIAWVADDGQAVHVGVGGYARRFQPSAALDAFRATIGSVVNLRGARLVERRGGRIPVGGVLSKLANGRGLAIGDAAGAVSPLTAGGLDPCLRLSELASRVIHRYLTTRDASELAAYDGRQFRRRFLVRRAMRGALSWAGYNPVLELGCAALRTPGGRQLAERVFFGRGSFPDVTAAAGATRSGSGGATSAISRQKSHAVPTQ